MTKANPKAHKKTNKLSRPKSYQTTAGFNGGRAVGIPIHSGKFFGVNLNIRKTYAFPRWEESQCICLPCKHEDEFDSSTSLPF